MGGRPIGANDGVLVVIGMFGGNDGLNMVVPFDDPLYYQQHGSLAIPAGQTLPIATGSGLNPALTEFKRFWDAGQLAVVQGVGYPNPDSRHFNSMATGCPGIRRDPVVGLARPLARRPPRRGRELFAAAEIGHSVPLHLIGASQRGTAVPAGKPGFGGRHRLQRPAASTRRCGPCAPTATDRGTARSAKRSSTNSTWPRRSPVIPGRRRLPDAEIVAGLEIAARLINANLGFRVLTAGWGDFDSHANQPDDAHRPDGRAQRRGRALLRRAQPGMVDRVTVMTFSEFGRTSWSNDGQGTDHGTAAPHFVFGPERQGRHVRPAADPGRACDRWDRMAHHVDFRSYYASIIDGWLGGGSTRRARAARSRTSGCSRAAPARARDGSTHRRRRRRHAPCCFVPVSPFRVADTRDGTGGVPNRPLGPGESIRVTIAGVGAIPAAA